MKFTVALACAALALLAGCSDPKNTKLPSDLTRMESITPQLAKLSDEERGLVAAYVMRRSMAGLFAGLNKTSSAPPAATVGDAINEQRRFAEELAAKEAAEKQALAQKKAEMDAAQKAMREMVSVGLLKKSIDVERGMSGIEMDRNLSVTFAFKNNSGKQIAGVKGLITALDLFGDEISAFQVSNDETIASGATSNWSGSRSIKYAVGGRNHDQKLADLADDKYALKWEPQIIVFADGTKVEAPR